jgi:hypothetical protein
MGFGPSLSLLGLFPNMLDLTYWTSKEGKGSDDTEQS